MNLPDMRAAGQEEDVSDLLSLQAPNDQKTYAYSELAVKMNKRLPFPEAEEKLLLEILDKHLAIVEENLTKMEREDNKVELRRY